jgi:hypothetical protein
MALSAQGMPVAKIAEVTFTCPDRVRDVLHNFTANGFDSVYPCCAGGRPPKFDLKQRARSTRSRCPGRKIITCRSRSGAWRSWSTS